MTKLLERYDALSEDVHEMRTLLTAIQGAVNEVLIARGGDKQLHERLTELAGQVNILVEWKNQSTGGTRMFRWILSGSGALLTAIMVYVVTTVNEDHTNIATLRQKMEDHARDDLKKVGP